MLQVLTKRYRDMIQGSTKRGWIIGVPLIFFHSATGMFRHVSKLDMLPIVVLTYH